MPSHRISISLHLWNVLSSPGRPNTMADSDDKRNVNAFFVMNLYSTALVPLNHIKTDVSLEEWEHVGKLSLPHDAIDLFIDFFFFRFHNSSSAFLCSKWVGFHLPEQNSYSLMCAEALYSRSETQMKCNFHWTDRATRWVSHWADQYCTQRGYSSQSWSRAWWLHPHRNLAQTPKMAAEKDIYMTFTIPAVIFDAVREIINTRTSCHVRFCFLFFYFTETLVQQTICSQSVATLCIFQWQFADS